MYCLQIIIKDGKRISVHYLKKIHSNAWDRLHFRLDGQMLIPSHTLTMNTVTVNWSVTVLFLRRFINERSDESNILLKNIYYKHLKCSWNNSDERKISSKVWQMLFLFLIKERKFDEFPWEETNSLLVHAMLIERKWFVFK